MNKFYSYMRISTQEERGKQKYSRQEDALKKYAEANNVEFWREFKEDRSGKTFDGRTEWATLEANVETGDTIVFKDLCRFSRNADEGYQKYMQLMKKGVNLVFLDNQTISTDYIRNMAANSEKLDRLPAMFNDFMVKVMIMTELDRAEKERLILSQRTKDGMAASPNKAGRKPGQVDKMTDGLRKDITLYLADRSITGADLMKKHGISRNTFKKYVELVKTEM